MNTKFYATLFVTCLIGLSSCNDKNDEYNDVGQASIVNVNAPSKAYMGDSIAISFNVSDNGNIQLSHSKLQ